MTTPGKLQKILVRTMVVLYMFIIGFLVGGGIAKSIRQSAGEGCATPATVIYPFLLKP